MEMAVDSSEVQQETSVMPGMGSAGRRWAVGWSSLVFAVLQSACTAFMAMSGLRLVIGISSTAIASGLLPLVKLHTDVLRIPMVLLAVVGAVANLYVIWEIRRLRARPAAQWRVTPLTEKQRRSERLQIVLAVVTLVLVALEESFHIYLHHVM
jgi:uncharacterized membrane protein YeaQ/YmgE (transglycosylase-associated protein family)